MNIPCLGQHVVRTPAFTHTRCSRRSVARVRRCTQPHFDVADLQDFGFPSLCQRVARRPGCYIHAYYTHAHFTIADLRDLRVPALRQHLRRRQCLDHPRRLRRTLHLRHQTRRDPTGQSELPLHPHQTRCHWDLPLLPPLQQSLLVHL